MAIVLGVLVPSVVLHEVSHGLVALAFGDDTAKRAGRLTLNPLPHVDPLGTVVLPLLLSLGGLGAFGYAKPVPVDPRRLRDPRTQRLWVSLAGPLVNVVLAGLAVAVLRAADAAVRIGDTVVLSDGTVTRVVFTFGVVNVVLAAFNLLPVPPLDGSALVERVLPVRYLPTWAKVRRFGFALVLLLVFALPDGLSFVFDPAVDLWASLL